MKNQIIDNEEVMEEPKETEEYLDLGENFKEIVEESKHLVGNNLFGLEQAPLIEGLPTIDLGGDNEDLFDHGLVMEF